VAIVSFTYPRLDLAAQLPADENDDTTDHDDANDAPGGPA
jgi:hypothetical protein